MSFHPGPKGEYCVVRWTAPVNGLHDVEAEFRAIDRQTTTDVHILHNGVAVFDGFLRLNGAGGEARQRLPLNLKAGDALDFVVGWGNGSHICDSTGLSVKVAGPDGRVHDAAREFSPDRNPNGPWTYGCLAPGERPDVTSFRLLNVKARGSSGSGRLLNLGNPAAWKWLVEHID